MANLRYPAFSAWRFSLAHWHQVTLKCRWSCEGERAKVVTTNSCGSANE